ncbi:uncharacterized protein LACBIDRAFT_297260 [Laccaria bicolor S238N-H82]|uniref:Predicted protein n=1 Tax=Laccaria bicolor (strain S238N-H82 / ATCC MYA-4686) TaxID=486041 RepID=B0DAD7_LACBS|nr:uncharacterized protein LACBIDRAFT_297260 [Laccaria bicolor S238N-H82]EDR08733.1 predicted protein [Laccaria bicolor S238N-H82]|eukprot:XP_001880958.1 predicted protein [Laccaria bicolor S238N-H82]
MLIGSFITMVIYGITTLQVALIWSVLTSRASLKSFIPARRFLDTLHVIFMCHAIHSYLVRVGLWVHIFPLKSSDHGFRKSRSPRQWDMVTICMSVNSKQARKSAISTPRFQTSIAINVGRAISDRCPSGMTRRRCSWHLLFKAFSHTEYTSALEWVKSIGYFTLILVSRVFHAETVAYLEFARLREVSISSVLPFGVLAILSDILIAMALCLLLDSNRSDFEDTNQLINRLIVFAINRCILTSAVAVIEMIIFLILPNSFYPFAIDFIIGKLYANSLLATLNSRVTLPRVGSPEQLDSTSFNVASVVHNHETESLALVGPPFFIQPLVTLSGYERR